MNVERNATRVIENKKCKHCPNAEKVVEDNRWTDAFGWAGTVDIWYECKLERCEDE